MDKKDLLLKRRATAATREVMLSPIEEGEEPVTVVVRGLTRYEVKECSGTHNAKSKEDLEKVDRNLTEMKMISKGLVEPEMSLEDVQMWLSEAPGGDSVKVMEAISDLSGMNEGSPKSNLQNVSSRSRRRR